MSETTVDHPRCAARDADALAGQGHPHAPRMLDDAARTAQQAADALGVALGQIAKSIIFRRKNYRRRRRRAGGPQGTCAWTKRRCRPSSVQKGGKLGRADADFVKDKTGFSIGGVSPLAHATPPVTLIDRELFRFDVILSSAAGHPRGVRALARRPGAPDRRAGARCDAGGAP